MRARHDNGVYADWVAESPGQNQVTINLLEKQVSAAGQEFAFDIDNGSRRMLLEGLDAIALTQTRVDVIQVFHEQRREQRPWMV